ncbi:MAG: hypothetical protein US50_C0034G0011 [Candidatus Nomurabacteria bacterium GW2011_GWB1_37_5]|uniref:Uncharacterized protein n=1 Tax=Candidatus Nomurabacteria bacterium GW2011_GWB1_37_5 TaxID=1618742 RepID=A0A0G0H8L4_9BACT|nr:MAG: hypothetical protein US50_C0034G0011 [Candidatus Nomurabacteria bacterium GW2011_GWB1_37_5]
MNVVAGFIYPHYSFHLHAPPQRKRNFAKRIKQYSCVQFSRRKTRLIVFEKREASHLRLQQGLQSMQCVLSSKRQFSRLLPVKCKKANLEKMKFKKIIFNRKSHSKREEREVIHFSTKTEKPRHIKWRGFFNPQETPHDASRR